MSSSNKSTGSHQILFHICVLRHGDRKLTQLNGVPKFYVQLGSLPLENVCFYMMSVTVSDLQLNVRVLHVLVSPENHRSVTFRTKSNISIYTLRYQIFGCFYFTAHIRKCMLNVAGYICQIDLVSR